MKKLLSVIMVLMLALGCFATANATEITDYHTYATAENETWCIQYSQAAADLNLLTNCLDSLLTNDPRANLLPNVAKEWGSEDGGLNWTFKLNEGIQWVNQAGEPQAETVAEDWLWGMEWILNFYKNQAANSSMLTSTVEGAEDYYIYVAGYSADDAKGKEDFEKVCDKYGLDKTPLTEEEAKALDLTLFKTIVKADAPDAYTLNITCIEKLPYFETLACYNCLYPISGKLLETIGVDGYFGVTPETLWYNGPYICTTFVHGNEKVFTKNPLYWNAANTKVFDSVTQKIVESGDVAFQYFQTGELDTVTLSQSNLMSLYNNESNEFHDFLVEGRRDKFSYSVRFNYDKNLEDGVTPDDNWNKAIANKNFRLALLYGWDPAAYLGRTNAINPISCQNLCYTAMNLTTTSEGRDYTELVLDNLGYTYADDHVVRYQPDVAKGYMEKAIEELTAQGVTFPVMMDYYIAGSNQTSMDTATVWKQSLTDCFGPGFVEMNICTYVSSFTQEVRNARKHSISLSGWGADYGDPYNFLCQETYGEANAFYSNAYTNVNNVTDTDLIALLEEYTKMVNDAKAITEDHDARLAAFAKAEAFYIENALALPWSYNMAWQLTGVNDYSKIYSAYGIQSNRWINWETKLELYTTEDYEAIKAAYNAGN